MLQLNGTSDYVTIPDDPLIDFGSDDWAVAFWLDLDAVPSAEVPILIKSDSPQVFGVSLLSGGILRCYLIDDLDIWDGRTNAGIGTGKVHIAIVKTTDFAFYVNGTLVPHTNASFDGDPDTGNAADLLIGYNGDTVYGEFGILDLRVFPWPVSAAAVADLYNEGRGSYYTDFGMVGTYPPAAVWPMTEGTGAVIDEKIGGMAGAITGGTWDTAVVPFYTVLEQITLQIFEILQTVTRANGYADTVAIVRPKRIDWYTQTPEDKTALLVMEGTREADEPVCNTEDRVATFGVYVVSTPSEKAVDSAETQANRLAGVIEKAMLADWTLGGLAGDCVLAEDDRSAGRDSEFAGVILKFDVHYRTRIGDPFVRV